MSTTFGGQMHGLERSLSVAYCRVCFAKSRNSWSLARNRVGGCVGGDEAIFR